MQLANPSRSFTPTPTNSMKCATQQRRIGSKQTMLSIIPLLIVSQFTRPLPVATQKTPSFQHGYVKASSTFNTGLIPFEMEFTCTFDFVGPINGCFATYEIDLSETDASGNYIWRGSQPPAIPRLPIDQAEAWLSGIRVYYDSFQSDQVLDFNELYVEVRTYKLTAKNIAWYVYVNWRDRPNTMVDTFTVSVGGEVLWSTTTADSRIRNYVLNCTGPGETCDSTTVFNNPSPPVVAAALGRTQHILTTGTAISGLSNKVSFGAQSPTKTFITSGCGIRSAAGVDCEQSVVALMASSSEAEGFTSGAFTGSGSQFAPLTNNSQTPPPLLSPHREMACGLREFDVYTLLPGKFGGINIGAGPNDCGFTGVLRYFPGTTGTWQYNGPMRQGIRIGDGIIQPYSYDNSFVLDGVKLLWP